MSKIPNSLLSVIGEDISVTCFNPVAKCPLNKMTDDPCIQFSATKNKKILEGTLSSHAYGCVWDLYSEALDICTTCCIEATNVKSR